MTKDDPVVKRVRAARRRIAERCGFDKHRMYELIKEMEAQYKDRLIGYERVKTDKPSEREK
jgi:ribosomal protein L17